MLCKTVFHYNEMSPAWTTLRVASSKLFLGSMFQKSSVSLLSSKERDKDNESLGLELIVA